MEASAPGAVLGLHFGHVMYCSAPGGVMGLHNVVLLPLVVSLVYKQFTEIGLKFDKKGTLGN